MGWEREGGSQDIRIQGNPEEHRTRGGRENRCNSRRKKKKKRKKKKELESFRKEPRRKNERMTSLRQFAMKTPSTTASSSNTLWRSILEIKKEKREENGKSSHVTHKPWDFLALVWHQEPTLSPTLPSFLLLLLLPLFSSSLHLFESVSRCPSVSCEPLFSLCSVLC